MHFLISSIRQLLRRFKAVAVINVAGLAVAFAVVVVVALQVRYDLSYDRGFKNSKEIFTVETDWGSGGGYSQSVNWNLPHLWKDRIPEIKEFCLVEWGPPEMAFKTEESGDETAVNASAAMVTSGFMNVFTPEIVAGDASETFTGPGAQSGQGHCIISETTARAIFGDENPVGRVIVSPQYYVRLTVDAVYRDFPAGSSIASGVIATTQDQGNIGNFSWAGYFMFDPADREAVLTKMNDRQWLVEVGNGRYDNYSFGLTGITDYYLHGGVEGKGGHAGYTTYLAVIGLLILIVAIINFINLSMAMAPSRVRTINIHRILGIGTRQMRFQLSLESVAMALAAVAIGCFIIHWFGGTVFTGFFTADLSLRHNVFPVAIAAAALLVVAFAVGAYSAHYASSFDAAIALKSSFALSRRGAGLRNTLIVVQFVTAVFFICFAGYVKLQYDYMSNFSIGYEKENIVLIPAPADSLARASIRGELLKNPEILDYTLSIDQGGRFNSWGGRFEGQQVTYAVWPADYNMLDFFGVDIVAGENFSAERGGEQMIFNEEFLRIYDFAPEDVIGKSYSGQFRVMGISENINFETLHSSIRPQAFIITDWGNMNMDGYVKISGNNVPATLDYIEQTWQKFRGAGGAEYSLSFLDDKIDALYRRELNTSQLIGILGLVAVLIAVMGVFGLVMFNTRYKTREIAIRKVNGATIGDIALMLNRNMLILVGVAFVVAVPLALVFIGRWVEGYAYKAAAPWWLFACAGVLVLMIAVSTVAWQSYRAATANPVESLKSE